MMLLQGLLRRLLYDVSLLGCRQRPRRLLLRLHRHREQRIGQVPEKASGPCVAAAGYALAAAPRPGALGPAASGTEARVGEEDRV